MHPAILVIANLVLFVASFFGAFAAMAFVTKKWIGFFHGARMAAFTEGDAKSERKHRILLVTALITLIAASAWTYVALGSAIWGSYALAASIGLGLGIMAAYHMHKDSLLPEGWTRKN